MRSLARLVAGYLLAGCVIAAVDNWMAHVNAGSSILEVIGSSMPLAEKLDVAYRLVVFPIFAWPLRVIALVRGG